MVQDKGWLIQKDGKVIASTETYKQALNVILDDKQNAKVESRYDIRPGK